MNDTLVLIIDPYSSSLKEQITGLINSRDNMKCLPVVGKTYSLNMENIDPILILVLLDNCDPNDFDEAEYYPLMNFFPSVPIICLIDTNNGFKSFHNCRDFAWSFITTPVSEKDLNLLIDWYVRIQNDADNRMIEATLKQKSVPDIYIGVSPAASAIKNKLIQIAPHNVTVLLQGETGTGKELCAKLIHYLSSRSQGPFVPVNCGAVPVELFENEFFGHKKGAYTHADTSENGLVYSADNGTLFLDEIEALPVTAQVKLLRFIEEKTYRPLGQSSTLSADVRLIAATNKNLNELVKAGKFREDLYYRLSGICLSIPPLREKREDIPLLVEHFVKRFSALYSKNILGVKPEAMMHLILYHWQGNVREMENVIQQAIILNNGNWIEVENLDFSIYQKSRRHPGGSFQKVKSDYIESFERSYLVSALKVFNGNISRAAKFAGKDRREFYKLIKKYRLDPDYYRSDV
jgi:two-component system response regulator GlrR